MLNTNEDIFFNETYYSSWRERMKGYLKTKGPGVWETIACKLTTVRNQSKHLAKNEAKKKHSTIIKAILDILSDKKKNWDNAHLLKNYGSSYRISIMLN